jgi:hypothetical protein
MVMNGASNEGPILTCIGKGYLPWQASNGEYLFIKYFYSPDVAETILSPTDVCTTYNTDFCAWSQYSNIDTKTGTIKFIPREKGKQWIVVLENSATYISRL